jgi:hypothetical protein
MFLVKESGGNDGPAFSCFDRHRCLMARRIQGPSCKSQKQTFLNPVNAVKNEKRW